MWRFGTAGKNWPSHSSSSNFWKRNSPWRAWVVLWTQKYAHENHPLVNLLIQNLADPRPLSSRDAPWDLSSWRLERVLLSAFFHLQDFIGILLLLRWEPWIAPMLCPPLAQQWHFKAVLLSFQGFSFGAYLVQCCCSWSLHAQRPKKPYLFTPPGPQARLGIRSMLLCNECPKKGKHRRATLTKSPGTREDVLVVRMRRWSQLARGVVSLCANMESKILHEASPAAIDKGVNYFSRDLSGGSHGTLEFHMP